MRKKKTISKKKLTEIQNKKLLAELQDSIDKARLADEQQVLDDLKNYFTEKLVPVKGPVVYKDLDDYWDGSSLPIRPVHEGPAYQRMERATIHDENGMTLEFKKAQPVQYDINGRIVPEVVKTPPPNLDMGIELYSAFGDVTHVPSCSGMFDPDLPKVVIEQPKLTVWQQFTELCNILFWGGK
jgi:hypothetical protein